MGASTYLVKWNIKNSQISSWCVDNHKLPLCSDTHLNIAKLSNGLKIIEYHRENVTALLKGIPAIGIVVMFTYFACFRKCSYWGT